MSKINLLDSSVFNRIAAGEVVERPCSIVKELIENSVDAEASIISVEIKNGGLDFIKITDNGYGLEKDDLEKAFLPHATSKIKNLDDLNSIMTLGFRGEALTSIASVAKVTMVSKTAVNDLGNYIIIENGAIIEKGECGCPLGTSVTVENLFKNIPARAKFLSKPSAEEAIITDTVSRLIITNYSKSIKYTSNNKIIYQSVGDNLKNAIYAVYGKSFTDNLVPIEYVMSDITLRGFINKPYFTKPNRTYQTLIVNGRYVVNSDVSYCVYNCYQNYLMKRQFPIFIMELNVPPDMIDVNVHPNKLEIKFADGASIKRVIYNTVKNKLTELTSVPKEIIKSYNSHSDTKIIKSAINDPETEVAAGKDISRSEIEQLSALGTFFTLNTKTNPILPAAPSGGAIHSPRISIFSDDNTQSESVQTRNLPDKQRDLNNSFGSIETVTARKLIPRRQYKTCLFNTYIIVEAEDYIIMIDQHAAHERLLYDKLVKQHEYRAISSQSMLIPYIFNVTPIENEALSERLDDINACGFSLNKLSGMSYSLSAVPLLCADLKTDYFISLILSGLKSQKYKKLDFIKEILMQSACKAAVKGEDKLDNSEIEFLIKQFDDENKVLMCPHGRPLMVKITKNEIEKWFKRTI